MYRIKIYNIVATICILLMWSCVATQTYKAPQISKKQYLFRLDSLSNNGPDIARQNWKDFFKDDLLKTYIKKALQNNQDNKIAFKTIQIFNAQYKQGKAGYLPIVSLGANVQKSTIANAPSNQDFTQYQVNVNLSWEVDIWGKITSKKLASKAEFLKSITAQKLLQTQLVANVANTYYRLIEADKRKEILKKTIFLRKESLRVLKNLKEAGEGNSLSVLQAKAQLSEVEVLLTSVNNEIFALENALTLLIGSPINSIKRNSIDTQIFVKEFQIGLPLEILANRPDVKESELNFLLSFENYNIAKASLYPSIKLSANTGTQGPELLKLFKGGSFFSTLLGGLTQPVFNGRQLRTRKEVSFLQMKQSLYRFQQQVLKASLEVSDVLKEFETSSKNVMILTKQEIVLNKAFDDSKMLLKAGLANYLDVLTAQGNLLNTQLKRIQTKSRYLQNLATIYKALGGGIN